MHTRRRKPRPRQQELQLLSTFSLPYLLEFRHLGWSFSKCAAVAPTPSCDFHSFPQGMKLNSESRSCPRRRRYGDRVSRAACNITSITRFGSVDIGVWSTWCDLTFARSEEHTSELQSLTNLVCRLL